MSPARAPAVQSFDHECAHAHTDDQRSLAYPPPYPHTPHPPNPPRPAPSARHPAHCTAPQRRVPVHSARARSLGAGRGFCTCGGWGGGVHTWVGGNGGGGGWGVSMGGMRRRRGPDEVRALLHRRRDLLEAGESERSIDRSVRDGVRVHVRRGWYVDRAAFDELYTEDAHLLHVMAVAHEVRGHAAVSHESAAVLHGLDLYRVRPTRVHLTTAPGARVSSSPDAFRHCTPLDAHDVVEVNGIRCTSLARTVFDVARTMTPEAALVIADRAERIWCDHTGCSPDDWRMAMAARIAEAGAARGIRRARWVAGFADGRAESTLESVSRFRLHQLGFRSVRLQVPIAGPRGAGWYRVDFGLDTPMPGANATASASTSTRSSAPRARRRGQSSRRSAAKTGSEARPDAASCAGRLDTSSPRRPSPPTSGHSTSTLPSECTACRRVNETSSRGCRAVDGMPCTRPLREGRARRGARAERWGGRG